MENYSAAKKLERIIVLSMLSFVVVFVVAICSFVYLGNARNAQARQVETISSLTRQEETLRESIENFKSEEYKTNYYRNELGMIKKGNKIYIYS